jgi:hypothetical protein
LKLLTESWPSKRIFFVHYSGSPTVTFDTDAPLQKMNESGDIVMQDVDEDKRETPLSIDETIEASAMEADASTPSASGHKPLPPSIIPPNKASTAPSQEVIERFAPGSAPHWVGASSFFNKESGSKEAGGSALIKT